jgi:hypothetical protein
MSCRCAYHPGSVWLKIWLRMETWVGRETFPCSIFVNSWSMNFLGCSGCLPCFYFSKDRPNCFYDRSIISWQLETAFRRGRAIYGRSVCWPTDRIACGFWRKELLWLARWCRLCLRWGWFDRGSRCFNLWLNFLFSLNLCSWVYHSCFSWSFTNSYSEVWLSSVWCVWVSINLLSLIWVLGLLPSLKYARSFCWIYQHLCFLCQCPNT